MKPDLFYDEKYIQDIYCKIDYSRALNFSSSDTDYNKTVVYSKENDQITMHTIVLYDKDGKFSEKHYPLSEKYDENNKLIIEELYYYEVQIAKTLKKYFKVDIQPQVTPEVTEES